MRIVSLLPGATESLYALGLGGQIVAVTHECDHPQAALGLPRVTRSRLALGGLSGGAIDAAVNAALASGTPLYEIDVEAVRELRPDLVIAQDVCEVCAVGADSVADQLRGIRLLRQHPHSLDEVLGNIEELGAACTTDAGPLLSGLRARIEQATSCARGRRIRTVFLEWLDPPFGAGHWTPQMLDLAGLDDPIARPGLPSIPTTWAAVARAEPELLVLAPCGFDQARAEQEMERMRDRAGGGGEPHSRLRRVRIFQSAGTEVGGLAGAAGLSAVRPRSRRGRLACAS